MVFTIAVSLDSKAVSAAHGNAGPRDDDSSASGRENESTRRDTDFHDTFAAGGMDAVRGAANGRSRRVRSQIGSADTSTTTVLCTRKRSDPRRTIRPDNDKYRGSQG
jgi:hypothetical protein